jgi:hypothetical protein
MICSNCKYYIPLVARSYDLSKCLKFETRIKVALDKCKGNYFESKSQNMSLVKFSLQSSLSQIKK